ASQCLPTTSTTVPPSMTPSRASPAAIRSVRAQDAWQTNTVRRHSTTGSLPDPPHVPERQRADRKKDLRPAVFARARQGHRNPCAYRSPRPRATPSHLPVEQSSSHQNLNHSSQGLRIYLPVHHDAVAVGELDLNGPRRSLRRTLERRSTGTLGRHQRRGADLHRQQRWRVLRVGFRIQQPLSIQLPPGEHLVGVDLMAPCDRGHGGTTNMGLLDDPSLLFQGMLTARPGAAAEGIRRDGLFWGGVHLNPTWTPTMCPRGTSSPLPIRQAMRPGSDAYVSSGGSIETLTTPSGVPNAPAHGESYCEKTPDILAD